MKALTLQFYLHIIKMLLNMYLVCVVVLLTWGRGGTQGSSLMRKLFFRDILTSRRPNLHLGNVLSFVTELEIHSYMAKLFLLFFQLKYVEQNLTWLNVVSWHHTEKAWCRNLLAQFSNWFILTINKSAVYRSTSATLHSDPQPVIRSHIQMNCTHSEPKGRTE